MKSNQTFHQIQRLMKFDWFHFSSFNSIIKEMRLIVAGAAYYLQYFQSMEWNGIDWFAAAALINSSN